MSSMCHPGRPASHAGSVSWRACRSLRRMAAAQRRGGGGMEGVHEDGTCSSLQQGNLPDGVMSNTYLHPQRQAPRRPGGARGGWAGSVPKPASATAAAAATAPPNRRRRSLGHCTALYPAADSHAATSAVYPPAYRSVAAIWQGMLLPSRRQPTATPHPHSAFSMIVMNAVEGGLPAAASLARPLGGKWAPAMFRPALTTSNIPSCAQPVDVTLNSSVTVASYANIELLA